jgi:hypothetical protein
MDHVLQAKNLTNAFLVVQLILITSTSSSFKRYVKTQLFKR